jgi:uncharacterized protein YfiM (DUF2279 family)
MTKWVCIVLLLFSTLAYGQRDKMYHSGAGFGITLSISAVTHHPTLGLVAGVGAGIGKELWDSQRRGHEASAKDALATAAGSASAFVLWKYALARKKPTIAAVTPPQQTSQNSPPPRAATAAASGAR